MWQPSLGDLVKTGTKGERIMETAFSHISLLYKLLCKKDGR